MKAKLIFVPSILLTIAGACTSNPNDLGSNASDQAAQVSLALSGGDFSNNSVRICGTRPAPDGKYLCNSFLSPPDAGTTDCPCFNFNADGSLVDPTTGLPAVVDGLCPSNDFPNGDWTFQYAIFSSPDCSGTQLNDGTHNFTCYDSHDIGTQLNPNESVEALSPGLNTNHILCTTTNASKQWNFESCAVTTTSADMAAGETRLDCGCTPVGNGTCNCGADGVGPGDLETGCSFDTATCDIVCTVTPDAGVPDAGVPDTGVPDAGVPDTGVPDAEIDTGVPDTGVPDTGVPDTGVPDAEIDTGVPDAEVDTGVPDAEVDTGVPDAGPVVCPELLNPVAGNDGFLVVVSGAATLTSNENEGTLAIGGDLTLGGETFTLAGGADALTGLPMFGSDTHATALVVGGRVDLAASNMDAILNVESEGYIKIGDLTGVTVLNEDQNGDTSVDTHVVLEGNAYNQTPQIALTVQQPLASVGPESVINFPGLFSTYKQNSAALADCENNVVLTNAEGEALPGEIPAGTDAFITLQPGTNVLNITAQNLNNIADLTFEGTELEAGGATLLINVDTTGVSNTFNWTVPNFSGIGGDQAQFVLLNFPTATAITQEMASATCEGTIFAPQADFVDLSPSNNEGNIVVASYAQGAEGIEGGEVHVFPFLGQITCTCPTQP